MVSSEISSSNLSEYTLFQMQNYFFYYENQFLSKKWKKCRFCLAVFFSKYFQNSSIVMIVSEISPKYIRLHPVFIKEKNVKLIKIRFFLVKK